MRYLKVKLRVYYGGRTESLPSTTLGGALTYYSIFDNKPSLNGGFGFSDFFLIEGSPYYVTRNAVNRLTAQSFPHHSSVKLTRDSAYGLYEGCVVGDLKEGRQALKGLILLNFSEVQEVSEEVGGGPFYALSLPVSTMEEASAFGEVVRVRFLKFHGFNSELCTRHPIYVLDGGKLREIRKSRVTLVDVKLNGDFDFNVLPIEQITDPLAKLYVSTSHGVVVPRQCYVP